MIIDLASHLSIGIPAWLSPQSSISQIQVPITLNIPISTDVYILVDDNFDSQLYEGAGTYYPSTINNYDTTQNHNVCIKFQSISPICATLKAGLISIINPPTNVKVSMSGPMMLVIDWTKSSSNVTGYDIIACKNNDPCIMLKAGATDTEVRLNVTGNTLDCWYVTMTAVQGSLRSETIKSNNTCDTEVNKMCISCMEKEYSLNTFGWKPLSDIELQSIRNSIDHYDLQNLSPTCNVTSKIVGDVVHLGAKPKDGTAPYRVDWYKVSDTSTPLKTITNIAEGVNVTYDYTTVSGDIGASVDFITKVTDSCPSSPKTNEEKCTISISSTTTSILTTINLSAAAVSITTGNTDQITAACKDQNNNVMTCPTLTWTTNNSGVANVDTNGIVTGIGVGNATITATSGSIHGTVAISVTTSPVVGACGQSMCWTCDINGDCIRDDVNGAYTSCSACNPPSGSGGGGGGGAGGGGGGGGNVGGCEAMWACHDPLDGMASDVSGCGNADKPMSTCSSTETTPSGQPAPTTPVIPTTPTKTAKSNIKTIIEVVAGLAIVGGVGYYAYTKYEEGKQNRPIGRRVQYE